MNKKNISMVAILLVVVSLGAFAASNSDLKGRDFVRLGSLGIVSGTLSEEGGEWYLTTGDDEYALHLGKYEVVYPKGINLSEGSGAVVRGFVLDSDVVPVTVATGEDKYTLRTVAGLPLWAGQGERENQQAFQHKGTGQANYRQPVPMVQNRQASVQNPVQGMQGRQMSYQHPSQRVQNRQVVIQNPVQGRQAAFQGPNQGRQVVQNGPRGRR